MDNIMKWVDADLNGPPDDGLYLVAEPYVGWGGMPLYQVEIRHCKSSLNLFSGKSTDNILKPLIAGCKWCRITTPADGVFIT